MTLFNGILAADSDLWKVFPEGKVPVTSACARVVLLGDDPKPTLCYFVDLERCSAAVRIAIAFQMALACSGTIFEAIEAVNSAAEVPIRLHHIDRLETVLVFLPTEDRN